MKASKIFRNIKSDRTHLLRSYLKDMGILSVIILILITTKAGLHIQMTGVQYLILLPLAIINGLIIASLLHNTSHNNIKNALLNRFIGEYCGHWVLYGFSNFVFIHFLHHQHSDGELDPVNPKGMNFVVFLTAPMRYMIRAAKKFLNMTHGHHADFKIIMNVQSALFHLNLLLRLTSWYLLLGKSLFLAFYIPGLLSIIAIFAHINFICHKETENGVVIQNLDHNIYYRLANFFTMGGYYHKNHHLNMKLLDPRELNNSSALSQFKMHSVQRL